MMDDEDMMDNEDRADLGAMAVMAAATVTEVANDEADTAIRDVLSYVAHLCDRCGLDPKKMFEDGLDSYYGDFEDAPRRAAHALNAGDPLPNSSADSWPVRQLRR
jgi:hypothetical protein